jgi:hypothetical protein
MRPIRIQYWDPGGKSNTGFRSGFSPCLLRTRPSDRQSHDRNTAIVSYPTRLGQTTGWRGHLACGLSTAERTGSLVLHTLWSYVLD